MSKKETLVIAIAAIGILVALPLLFGGGKPPEAPKVATGPAASWSPTPRTAPARLSPPPAPGGVASVPRARRTDRVEPAGLPVNLPAPVIWCDDPALTILGEALRRGSRCQIERASRRDVIEHVLTERAGVGLVTIEPSPNERRLGVMDLVIGAFEPVCVVNPGSPRVAPRDQFQAVLSGAAPSWPWSNQPVRLVGPTPGKRADLLAELLVPGDPLAIATTADRHADVIRAVRGRRDVVGIVHRAVVPTDGSVVTLEIDGVRPSLEVRVVYRNQYDRDCAALLQFVRSAKGRELLGQRLTLR